MSKCHLHSSAIKVRIFGSTGNLPENWDSLLPRGHFLNKAQLRISEQSGLPNVQFLYVLIENKGLPAAVAYFQVLSLQPEHINPTLVSKQKHFLWSAFTRVAHPKLLVAGHLFRHDICSFHFHAGTSPFDAYQYYKKGIDAAIKYSCAAAVLVKDAPKDLTTYFQNFAPEYIFLRNDISMELGIPASWQSIQDYEHALKHKYAQRFRKIRSLWNGLDVKELSKEEVLLQKDNLFLLYRQVCERQQVRLGLLSPDFIVQQKLFYNDDLKVWGIYEEDKMIAFYSAWVKGDVFDMFYIGFDYHRNTELQLYFNILFFSVEQAIAFGKKKLILGRTALDAKARLGCSPRYLSTFLYIRNPILRKRVLAINNRNSSMEGAWEERHPFKSVD